MITKWKLLVLVLFLGLGVQAQTQQNAAAQNNPEVLLLKETGYDFGKIPQGRPVTHIFTIVNTGTKPLLLENVQASCGCTTPEWSKDPIKPGASSTIKVGYNAAAEGYFSKSITIQYNVQENKMITITGTVYKTPNTSAPANNGVTLLKYQ